MPASCARVQIFVTSGKHTKKNKDETFKKSVKQDFFKRILRGSANTNEGSGSQLFRTTTEIQ